MSYFDAVPSIPLIRPHLNVGCLFDHITCTAYLPGKHGEMILNGGMANIMSIAGPANSFKSVLLAYHYLTAGERYTSYQGSIYDPENTFTYTRLNRLARRFPKMSMIDHGSELLTPEEIRFKVTSTAEEMGDEYFEIVKGMFKAKIKEKKNLLVTTPFINSRDESIQIMKPTGIIIDSLSQLEVSSINEKSVDKNAIGDGANNMMFARGAIAKKQLFNQAVNMGPAGSMYFLFSAHVGDEFEILDPYAPKKHTMTHARKGSKTKGVTEAFKFLNYVVYEIFSVALLNNKERNTGVLYPKDELDRGEDPTDLLLVTIKPTRNKGGPSGVPMEIVVSQREGLLPHLTQFHYVKEADWGLVGNNLNYSMALYPDVKLGRTTVRGKIDEDYKLRRAIEITSDMLQMKQCWEPLPDDLMCDPETLYRDIKNLGYDWNVLLETRGWWCFEEDAANELPFLSTMDILRMRTGQYKPYWLK